MYSRNPLIYYFSLFLAMNPWKILLTMYTEDVYIILYILRRSIDAIVTH